MKVEGGGMEKGEGGKDEDGGKEGEREGRMKMEGEERGGKI